MFEYEGRLAHGALNSFSMLTIGQIGDTGSDS
jgi:hypothetical protein